MRSGTNIVRHTGRALWTAFGIAALALGALGLFLPLLPTTPLVILAAFAFGKGSPRLQAMLEENRHFGPIIADWRAKGAIAPRYKAMAIAMMGFALAASVAMDVRPMILAVQVLCMGAAAAFILTRPGGAA